ncbi:MAG: hypothetical protein RIB67_01480 [Miltoncostaeaceae bacterium]
MRTGKLRTLAAVVAGVAAIGVAAAGCGSDDEEAAAPATTTEMVEDAMAGESPTPTPAAGESTGFVESVISLDDEAGTATLPLFEGIGPDGAPTYYIITESSDEGDAGQRGVTHAPKLANALGTEAVQRVTVEGDTVVFPGTVDFAPERAVVPGDTGFPPDQVTPGAVGDENYSPLITFDGRTVLNASQVANDSGEHDAVVAIDRDAGTVTLKTLSGFFNGSEVRYLRLDASVDVVATLEESTLAPNLGLIPGEGSNEPDSARSPIVPIVNGVIDDGDPDRQGLQSAVLGGVSPDNITATLPGDPLYSPLWDVTPAVWSDEAIAEGRRVLVTGNEQLADLVAAGDVISAGMGERQELFDGLRALGAVSNCPTLSIAEG